MNDEPFVVRCSSFVESSRRTTNDQRRTFYFLNNASNALRASSGVCGCRPLSAARSLTTFGLKNVHSFFACLLATRAGIFSRHSQFLVVSKKRQLPHV